MELKSTWVLKDKISKLKINCPVLKIEINEYIEKNCISRGIGSFVGITIRANLHYIIDHINDDNLLNKLKESNHSIKH